MAEELPYGTYWTRGEEARRWHDILEVTSPENVRALVANKPQGDWAMIRGEKITVGFAHEWLARHDSQKAERETKFQSKQIFWARWGPATTIIASLWGAARIIETPG
jgi:hypothetical protein